MRGHGRVATTVAAALLFACSAGGGTAGSRDVGDIGSGDTPAADRGAAPGGDADLATPDAPAEAAAEVTAPIATWTDPSTGLTWETHPTDAEVDWTQAGDHCSGLDGGAGWRLPDIDELRSLIRGCPDTVTGGACNESVACPGADSTCCNQPCMGCGWLTGPGPGGCYWPDALQGLCDWYWSATTAGSFTTYACFAHFAVGHLSHDDRSHAETHHVMCVR